MREEKSLTAPDKFSRRVFAIAYNAAAMKARSRHVR
jgi:hypothetical protein